MWQLVNLPPGEPVRQGVLFDMIFKRKSLKNIRQPSLSIAERRKRTRIVVIDDVESEFPHEILKREGYAIDYWSDIDDLTKLENGYYDIIILDIGGVGSKFDPENQGAGILKHLKVKNPSQVVVAYSGQSHDSDKVPFFKHADEYVPKPAEALLWKSTIDRLIEERLTIEHYWCSLAAMLSEMGVDERKRRKIEIAILNKRPEPEVKRLIADCLGIADNSATVLSILAKLLALSTA